MSYELAKQLKDAGFPQDVGDRKMRLRTDEVVIPTLEELIEACGEPFANLNYYGKQGGWTAHDITTLKGVGSTPSEAVAKLWLILNQKQV